jgi:hypothetical protein
VARALPGDYPVVRDTGILDADSGEFISTSGLAGVGEGIDAALRLMRVSGIDPDGDPAIGVERGMLRMVAAYEELRQATHPRR